MELCDVSSSVLTVWKIQRWLMVLQLSSDNSDQLTCCRDWYDQAVRSHVLPPLRERRTALSSFPGWAFSIWACLAVMITACTVENTIFELVKQMSTICVMRQSSSMNFWKKVCVHVYRLDCTQREVAPGGKLAYLTPWVRLPWLLKFCANYISKSLVSLIFSVAFS